MDDFLPILSLITAVGSGMVAGVLFAFSAFVMKALSRLTAEQGIAAMQSINITVLSLLCSLLFFGTGLASVFLVIVALNRINDPGAVCLLSGGLLYIVALFVTGAFNVPLNNRLAVVEPSSSDGARIWSNFIPTWTRWNHVRTIASLASSVSLILAFHILLS